MARSALRPLPAACHLDRRHRRTQSRALSLCHGAIRLTDGASQRIDAAYTSRRAGDPASRRRLEGESAGSAVSVRRAGAHGPRKGSGRPPRDRQARPRAHARGLIQTEAGWVISAITGPPTSPSERIRHGCSVGHTIKGRIAAGLISSRRQSLAADPIAPPNAAMTDNCTCGSPISPDDRNCPNCGKPLDPEQAAAEEQAAEEQAAAEQAAAAERAARVERYVAWRESLRLPFRRGSILNGTLFYTTMIAACTGVVVQELVGSAKISGALLSHCVSLWAGVLAVLLFRLRLPTTLYPILARQMGLFTGLMMATIGIVLSEFASLTEWPAVYGEETVAYIKALPVVARLTSWMDPQLVSIAVRQTHAISFLLVHVGAAVLGSAIAFSMFCKWPPD